LKWQSLILTGILFAAVLFAGCTDVVPPGPAPGPGNLIQPGQVLYSTGEVTGNGIPGGTIDTITFTVGLAPGEKPVNMENLSIFYADAIRTETLEPVSGFHGEPPAGEWGIMNVIDEIGAPNNRLEDKEQFVIRINPKAPLVPRQFISIVVKPPSGPSLTLRRVSPSTIMKENNILAPL
jgi:flagellin FlaB